MFEGTSYLVGLQILSRSTTFLLNQWVLRGLDPDILGKINVQLDLWMSALLFLSREGIRMVILRSKKLKVEDYVKMVNLTYIPLAVGSLLVAISLLRDRNVVLSLYGLATLVELASEPMYILGQQQSMFGMRAGVEGMAVVGKTLSVVAFLTRMDPLQAFAASQLVYASILFFGYYIAWKRKLNDVKRMEKKKDDKESEWIQYLSKAGFTPNFPKGFSQLSTAKDYTLQSLIKLALNEGDRILLNILATTREQGIWAFVFNYGSLIVRMLLQPMEETSRVFFSQNPGQGKQRLTKTLHLYLLLSFPFIFVAPYFTDIVVAILGGSKWMDAKSALSAYCITLPLMALNGMVEGYVQSTANPQQLSSFSRWMIVCWIIYGILSYGLTRYFPAAPSLILASGFNSLMRMSWGMTNMVHEWPNVAKEIWISWIFTSIAIWLVEARGLVLKLVVGIFGTLVSLLIVWTKEKYFLKEIK